MHLGAPMSVHNVLEVAEVLLQLDPVRTYPRRGADQVRRLAGAAAFRLERTQKDAEQLVSDPPPPTLPPALSLQLRHGREVLGVLHLYTSDASHRLEENETRLARWGARVFARGLSYSERLATEGVRRSGETLSRALDRAPLTPRERDVVALLVAGSSTRDIAARTGLTVSTVNTYLKRIFSKLGVHSRVELVARMAGTEAFGIEEPNGSAIPAE